MSDRGDQDWTDPIDEAPRFQKEARRHPMYFKIINECRALRALLPPESPKP